MENIAQFINEFVEIDYRCNLGLNDLGMADDDYENLERMAKSFFWGNTGQYDRIPIESILDDPTWVEAFQQIYKTVLKRTVFQIRHYQSPQVGDILREKMKTDEVWGCLCSYHIDNGMDLDVTYMYFVAETTQGLKIIYKWGFEQDKHTWRQTHDHLPSRVEHAGKLLEVLNLQPPVEPASLQEYLHPTHTAIVIDN